MKSIFNYISMYICRASMLNTDYLEKLIFTVQHMEPQVQIDTTEHLSVVSTPAHAGCSNIL